MANVLVWADIPVTDLERAKKFYGKVLQVEEWVEPFPGSPVAIPPQDMGPVAFDLAQVEGLTPGSEGTRIYLSAMGDINGMVKRIEEAGGQIVMPPTDMGEMVGVMCFFIDSEGNTIGLQQPGPGPQ